MGILKTLTISHKREANGNYSILLQKNPPLNQECLVFEAGTVVRLGVEEADYIRRNGGYTKIMDGYACLGMLQYAHEGSKELLFMPIVTGCVSIGKIQNSEIFCITAVSLLSMRNGPDDQQLIQGLKRLLSSGSFYFSHSAMPNQSPYDLTLTAQRAHLTTVTDNRFFWNRLLFRHFERFSIDTSLWLVKTICGGINISTVYIGGLQAKACLISRLSCERAGTRFNVRGVNDLGHVANFVETEEVLFLNQIILSHLMTRGSIPLFWEQPGLQVGSHKIKMSRGSEISQAAYDKHMFLLKERFDKVVLINLLSSRESEMPLNSLFNAHHKASQIGSEFPFINFDYHAYCSRAHKENLEKFYTQDIEHHCNQFGFFHAKGGQVLQLQTGVLRINCLDCLDRTNSIQTFIGLKMLQHLIGALDRVDVGKALPRLTDVYEGLWLQNGDQISKIYAGTGALDGRNLLKDGTLSVARTLQNNLFDSGKQSAIDIMILGRTLSRDYSYRAASFLPHYYMFASPSILVNMCDRYLEYCKTEKINIVLGTWNVNGGRHFDNVQYNRARPLSDWLLDYKESVEDESGEADLLNGSGSITDIYAIGFQEIVDLNATNIVTSSTQNQRDWLVEIQKTISRDRQYLLVTSVQLVGVCLFIFIRAELAPYIKDVCNDQVKTGLGGATGNKGGVAIRFRYKATSLCFVCAHFAAGQSQVKERNDDYAEITRKIQFPMGRSINSHDYVFWCGDFNYRLDKIGNEEARHAASNGDYNLLVSHDQLRLAQQASLTFKGYLEGDIKFAPTYKYDAYSNEYDSSEKCRVPAYTDRILFKKRHPTHTDEELLDSSMIKFYNRVELLSSDHRPVVAELEIEVLEVDKELRNQVIDQILDECGPPDSTVFVKVDGHLDVTSDHVLTSVLKMLADEAGEIVLVRHIGSALMIIFSDGKSAVKASTLDGIVLNPNLPDNKLMVTLRTPDWQSSIRNELMNNMDNTPNLVTGDPPNVHLEDDEDEVAEELNMSIGPQIDPDVLCLSQECFFPNEAHLKTHILDERLSPSPHQPNENNHSKPTMSPLPVKSPHHIPMRPPPLPPPPHPARRELPPLPPQAPGENDPILSHGILSSPINDPFGFSFNNLDETSTSFGEPTLDETSFNLMELSASLEYGESRLPPPTMAPPAPPDLTPTKLLPSIPKQPPTGRLIKPTRAPPPPPIPSRSGNEESDSEVEL